MPDWKTLLRARLGAQPVDDEVVEELAEHADEMYRSAIRSGRSAAESIAEVEAELADLPAALRQARALKRRRLTPERARQLVTDFEQVTIRELVVDLRSAVDLGLELGIYAYDAYILEGARSSGFPLLALDGPIRRNAKKLGLSLVDLDR